MDKKLNPQTKKVKLEVTPKELAWLKNTRTLIKQSKKEMIEEILPELYTLRANIPLTGGEEARGRVGKLIERLEKEKGD